MTRIPAGSSGQHPAAAPAPAAAAAAPPAPAGKKTTKVRHRGGSRGGRAPRKSSNTGLVLGLGLGGVAFAIVIAAVILSGQNPPATPPSNPSTAGNPTPPPPPPPAPAPSPPENGGSADAPKPKPPVKENADSADWDGLMKALRPGGGFDALDRPEGKAFARVKSMGKGAYPHLVKYIGDEDVVLARAAVAVLNELTGRGSKLPNEATRAGIRADWEKWLADNK